MSQIRLVLADDHEMIRSGLRALAERVPNLAVIGEAADGRSAVRLAADLHPDVVVMDVVMPALNGVDATRQITDNDPNVRVICLSGRSSERMLSAALDAGALGFVRKESAFDELAEAVRTVVGGQTYISPSLADVAARPRDGATSTPRLSGREREVLQLIAEGKATKEVAHALGVSVKTVETHRANLMNKLNLFSVAELTKYAVREGMSSLE